MIITTTGSFAVWAVSNNFDTLINVYSGSNLVGSDDTDGFNRVGDIDNSAVNITQSGTFNIQLSSSNNAYSAGNYQMYISPGFDYLAQWRGGLSTNVPISYISSSGVICAVDNFSFDSIAGVSSSVVFYNIFQKTVRQYGFDTTYGGVYSPRQDRVFVLGFTGSKSSASIHEFDNQGNFITAYDIQSKLPAPQWNAAICYDDFNDRIFIANTAFNVPAKTGQYVVWDCATRNTIQSSSMRGAMLAASSFAIFNPTYVNANNCYYCSCGSGGSHPFVYVSASNYASASTSTTSAGLCQYVSASGLIWYVGPTNLRAMNPLTDTVVYSNSGGGGWTFGGSAVFDVCTQNTAVIVDNFNFPNATGMVIYDSTQSVVNFIAIRNTFYATSSVFTYGMCYAATGSRVYAVVCNQNDDIDLLYSCKISCPTASIQYP